MLRILTFLAVFLHTQAAFSMTLRLDVTVHAHEMVCELFCPPGAPPQLPFAHTVGQTYEGFLTIGDVYLQNQESLVDISMRIDAGGADWQIGGTYLAGETKFQRRGVQYTDQIHFDAQTMTGAHYFESDDMPFFRRTVMTFAEQNIPHMPVPPSALLLGAGVAALGLWRRDRRGQGR